MTDQELRRRLARAIVRAIVRVGDSSHPDALRELDEAFDAYEAALARFEIVPASRIESSWLTHEIMEGRLYRRVTEKKNDD